MYRLGIDLGGTNIAAGIVDENYKIIGSAECKTNAPRSAEEIADDIAAIGKKAAEYAGIKFDDIGAVGLGTPGSVNSKTGMIAFSANLYFENVPFAKLVSDRLGKPVYIENDANAAAYGEYIAGAGKNAENFVAVTLGTGVGGGIIINGRIYSGSNGAAGELGHITMVKDGVSCPCGRKGCFEQYASVSALVRFTKESMKQNPDSSMWELVSGNIDAVNGITSFKAAKQGDAAAKAVVDKFIEYVAIGISDIVNIFQPDILAIGGGISKEGETLLSPIRKIVDTQDYARNMKNRTVITAATLGNDAGIIGAAFLDKLH